MNTEESAEIVNDDSNPELMPARRTEQSLKVADKPTASTSQQLRIMEVSQALEPAYQKASTLELTDEEIAALTAPFPDEAIEIRPHDGLIYLPHINISDRLNKVFKPGKWALICRRHWVQEGTMYGEYVMLVRGCFIGESVGGHPYYPNNPKTNYSDTLESTAAEALRRIAGKRLSCGSQVWHPDFARNWIKAHAEKGRDGKWYRIEPKAPQDEPKAAEPTNTPPAPEKPSRKAPAKESAPKNTAPAPAAEAPKANGMSPEDRTEFINILQDHANKAVNRGVEQLIRFLQTRKTAKGRLLLAQGQTLTDLADADLKSLVNGWNSVLAPFAEFAEMNPPPPAEDAPDFTDKAADVEVAPKGKGEPDWLAGAGQPAQDEPRSDQPDDPGDADLQVEGFKVKGILQAVTVQQGTTARGAWTAHHCHVDGQKYTTFDKKIGEKAIGLKNKPVQIVFERTTKGNGVLSISAA